MMNKIREEEKKINGDKQKEDLNDQRGRRRV